MSESFPSVFRGFGIGLTAAIGRAGCIAVPFAMDTLKSFNI